MLRRLAIARRVAMAATPVLLILGCAPKRVASSPHGEAPSAMEAAAAARRSQIDLAHHFRAFDADGAFVLYDATADRFIVHDPARAARRMLPASTFKILNTLIVLDTGVLRDEHEVIRWDGVDRGNPDWNRDHSISTAFQASAVWFYQELARRVGVERMAAWLRRVGYGNADIGGGIDSFWLSGELRISAEEQIDFLRRLYAGTLPFSGRSMHITRQVMRFDEVGAAVLSGKTGWARHDGRHYGWLVGWVERDGETFFYATRIESGAAGFPMRRAQQEITRGILRELRILPAP